MPVQTSHIKIACQQIMTEDSSVFSVQWMDVSAEMADGLTADALLALYLKYIGKFTCGLIRPHTGQSGIEFRLGCTAISLISFLPPERDTNFTTARICGGFLVQPRQCDRGELRFGVEILPDCIRVSLQLSDFCPLLLGSHSPSRIRVWLYRVTQAAIHRLVTVRFLSLLYRELSGTSPPFQVIHVAVREGKPV